MHTLSCTVVVLYTTHGKKEHVFLSTVCSYFCSTNLNTVRPISARPISETMQRRFCYNNLQTIAVCASHCRYGLRPRFCCRVPVSLSGKCIVHIASLLKPQAVAAKEHMAKAEQVQNIMVAAC